MGAGGVTLAAMAEFLEAPQRWLVACLCADWCHVCQDYRAVFGRLASEFAEVAEFVWVDIEDDEAALDGVEVDDFPTLLIARGDAICHFAVVVPSAPAAHKVLRRALAGELASPTDASLEGLPERLRALGRASG